MRHITLLRTEEDGATAVEYGLMLAAITVIIAGSVLLFGQSVSDLFLIPAGGLDPAP